MRGKKARFISLVLSFCLILSLLPSGALAAEDTCTCGAQPDADGIVTHADDCPAAGTEEPAAGTDEPAAEVLTAPALIYEPLDAANSSDIVLTVTGSWDSYSWEVCSYGNWSPWSGDGPSLTVSKEEFISYGFRCTVTRGEESVTSEVYAYDPSVLQRPMLMANSLSGSTLEDSRLTTLCFIGLLLIPLEFCK